MKNSVLKPLLVSALGCVVSHAALYAQTPKARIKVAFTCTCEDTVSQQYASKFRDLLAESPRYVEVSASSKSPNGKADGYDWRISVVSLVDLGEDTSPVSIALSVVILYDGYMMTHTVQTCGREKIPACATGSFATLDQQVHDLLP